MPAQPTRVTDVGPADRVLFLGIPEPAVAREVASRLTSGVVVALGDDEEVRAARRELRELLNVMCVSGTPDEIPWQDAFFTQVFDTRDGRWEHPERVVAEIRRVRAKTD